MKSLEERAKDIIYGDGLETEDIIAQFKEAIAEAAPRWIPVTEKMPPRRVPVLVFGMWAGDEIITDERWDGRWYEHSDGIITHWMPLPKGPTQ